MSWEIKQFKDVVQFPPKISLEKGELYSFIPMEEISSGIKYVTSKNEKVWSGSGGAKFEDGDTLFARITPCLQNGKISQAKNLKNGKGFGSTEYFIFRGIENVSDSDFIYYFSLNEEFKKHAIGSMVGASGRQRADQKFVGEFEINLPPLETQKRIASILSTYDDLIENNLKRIKLLEETAQNIYKDWFVNFRFPNYEHTEFDAESVLPVGWEIKKLCELNTKITDGTHDSPKPTENGYPLITGKNLVDGFVDFSNSYFISQEDHEKIKSRSYLDLGDIMYSNIGTIGSTAIVCENFEYSCKNVIIFKPLSEHTNFLYCFLTNDMSKKLFLQGLLGSNQKFISLKYARDYKFLFPTTNLISNFSKTTKPIFDQKRCLFEMNQKLKEARDILLPRLMNRTIEV